MTLCFSPEQAQLSKLIRTTSSLAKVRVILILCLDRTQNGPEAGATVQGGAIGPRWCEHGMTADIIDIWTYAHPELLHQQSKSQLLSRFPFEWTVHRCS